LRNGSRAGTCGFRSTWLNSDTFASSAPRIIASAFAPPTVDHVLQLASIGGMTEALLDPPGHRGQVPETENDSFRLKPGPAAAAQKRRREIMALSDPRSEI